MTPEPSWDYCRGNSSSALTMTLGDSQVSPVCLREMTARKSSPFLVRNQGGRARVCARVCVGSWGAKPSPCTTFQPGSASEITHISCELPPQFPRGSRGPSRCSRGLILKMSLLPFPMIRASESSRTPLPPTHRLALGQSEGRGASGGQASGLVVTAALFARSLVNSLPSWLCGATEAGNNVAQTSPLGDIQ